MSHPDSSNQKPQLIELTPHRPLTSWERQVLDFLFNENFPSVHLLKRQKGRLKVRKECSSKCGTVVFSLEANEIGRAVLQQRIPVEAVGEDSEGYQINILLHVKDGYLHKLEIYCVGKEVCTELPSVNKLKRVVNEGVLGA